MWADQLVNRRKYVRHALTVAVLAIITALLITMSLLPLLDPWYQAAALLTGDRQGGKCREVQGGSKNSCISKGCRALLVRDR